MKSRLHLITNGTLLRIKQLEDMGWKVTTENDKYCISLHLLLEHETSRPKLKQLTEALAIFEHFANIRVKAASNEIILFIE